MRDERWPGGERAEVGAERRTLVSLFAAHVNGFRRAEIRPRRILPA